MQVKTDKASTLKRGTWSLKSSYNNELIDLESKTKTNKKTHCSKRRKYLEPQMKYQSNTVKSKNLFITIIIIKIVYYMFIIC